MNIRCEMGRCRVQSGSFAVRVCIRFLGGWREAGVGGWGGGRGLVQHNSERENEEGGKGKVWRGIQTQTDTHARTHARTHTHARTRKYRRQLLVTEFLKSLGVVVVFLVPCL